MSIQNEENFPFGYRENVVLHNELNSSLMEIQIKTERKRERDNLFSSIVAFPTLEKITDLSKEGLGVLLAKAKQSDRLGSIGIGNEHELIVRVADSVHRRAG